MAHRIPALGRRRPATSMATVERRGVLLVHRKVAAMALAALFVGAPLAAPASAHHAPVHMTAGVCVDAEDPGPRSFSSTSGSPSGDCTVVYSSNGEPTSVPVYCPTDELSAYVQTVDDTGAAVGTWVSTVEVYQSADYLLTYFFPPANPGDDVSQQPISQPGDWGLAGTFEINFLHVGDEAMGYPYTQGFAHFAIDPGACAPSDADGDGHPDDQDSCPAVPNPDQADNDGDQLGDACDPDDDDDGVADLDDALPLDPTVGDVDLTAAGISTLLDTWVTSSGAASAMANHLQNAEKQLAAGKVDQARKKLDDFMKRLASEESKGSITTSHAATLRLLVSTALPGAA